MKLSFQGYPSRDYSPTSPTHRSWDPSQLVFHIKVYPRGAVSSCLGGAIRTGHRVIVEGPFGGAFYRPGPTRLVLVGTTTGWAPLWAIARAARLEEPDRRMRVVVGARRSQNLYERRFEVAAGIGRQRSCALLFRREHRRTPTYAPGARRTFLGRSPPATPSTQLVRLRWSRPVKHMAAAAGLSAMRTRSRRARQDGRSSVACDRLSRPRIPIASGRLSAHFPRRFERVRVRGARPQLDEGPGA